MGLINRVVPDAELKAATREFALEIAERGPFALASRQGRLQRPPRRRLRLCRAWRTTCCCAAISTPTRARSSSKSFARQAQAGPVEVRTV